MNRAHSTYVLFHAAYYRDIPVGVICCRVEKVEGTSEAKIYCMTMGVLAVSLFHTPPKITVPVAYS